MLIICSIAHLLTDAVCAATLFGQMNTRSDFYMLLIVYNTLAFSTQAIVGIIADRWQKVQWLCGSGAMILVVLGFFIPGNVYLKTVLIGFGNSVFHVSCGQIVLIRSSGKAISLGVFVAPGAIGLSIGTLFPEYGSYYSFALLIAAAAMIFISCRGTVFTAEKINEPEKPVFPVILLTLAVAVRAIGGGAVHFPWKNGAMLSILLTCVVFAGKFSGGFLCQAIGPIRSAILSLLVALPLVLFAGNWIIPSVIGQFALNLTMPVTLWLLYLEMPSSPGFAFGLAASALWPGTLIGGILKLEGFLQQFVVGFCFLFALFAVVFAVHHLNNGKGCSL